MEDAKLISGEFFDISLPKEKTYLYKYFKTPVQQQFVRYTYVMDDSTPQFFTFILRNFVNHTGYRLDDRKVTQFLAKYRKIEEVWQRAKKDLDFELLKTIEDGNLKC